MASASQGKIRKMWLTLGQCLMVFGFLIHCKSMWTTLENVEDLARKTAYVLIFLGIALSLWAMDVLHKRMRLIGSIAVVGFFAVYLLLYLFITDFAHRTFLRDVIVFLALLLYYFFVEEAAEIPGILRRYEQIVAIVALVSILCWLAVSIFQWIPSSGTAMTWWNGTDHFTPVKSYYGIYYTPQTLRLFGVKLIRNCGFFTEAPMASLHFTLAFLINLFLRKKVALGRLVITGLAILTTFSVIGIVICVLAVLLKILWMLLRSDGFRAMAAGRKREILILLAVVACCLLVGCLLLVRDKAGTVSWRIRVQDLKASFAAWLDRPIFGNGIYNFEAVKMHFPASRAANAGFSCTTALGTILADGGAMFGLLYIGSVVLAIVRSIRNREYPVAFFAILIFLIFTFTIVPYDYIILLLFIFLGAYRSKAHAAVCRL